MGEIENEVLVQEGIKTEELQVNVLSRTGGRGGLRAVVTPVRDFKLQSVSANQEGTSEAK